MFVPFLYLPNHKFGYEGLLIFRITCKYFNVEYMLLSVVLLLEPFAAFSFLILESNRHWCRSPVLD